jgi:hypothetical protein
MRYHDIWPGASPTRTAFDGQRIPGEFPENCYKSFTSGCFTWLSAVAFRRRHFVSGPVLLSVWKLNDLAFAPDPKKALGALPLIDDANKNYPERYRYDEEDLAL